MLLLQISKSKLLEFSCHNQFPNTYYSCIRQPASCWLRLYSSFGSAFAHNTQGHSRAISFIFFFVLYASVATATAYFSFSI